MKKNEGVDIVTKKKLNEIECLDDCDVEEEGFIEGDIDLGKAVASFNFSMNENPKTLEVPAAPKAINSKDGFLSNGAKGLTPAIDGEFFTIKRGYQFRPSTIRKLNELKTLHPNINAYLNTILDEAILHYYNYIIKEKGKFKGN